MACKSWGEQSVRPHVTVGWRKDWFGWLHMMGLCNGQSYLSNDGFEGICADRVLFFIMFGGVVRCALSTHLSMRVDEFLQACSLLVVQCVQVHYCFMDWICQATIPCCIKTSNVHVDTSTLS